MIRSLLSLGLLFAAGACRSPSASAAPEVACACPAPSALAPVAVAPPGRPARADPTAHAPQVEPLPVCEADGKLPLDAARDAFDAHEYERALSCAAQAAALAPGDVLAHAEKGNALGQLGRHEEAALAFARALAVDPDSLDALAGAAHLYAVVRPSSREFDELGSTYAERGFELASAQRDEAFAVSFARLSAMAFNDLGQAQDAVERAEWVLSREKADPEARYERAVGLFELCRFAEARAAFALLVKDPERAAFAHHHLGLLAERDGRDAEAREHFDAARAADPEGFPPPVLLPPAEFRAALEEALAGLAPDMRQDLAGVPVGMEDLPQARDLTAGEPPLSPTILGLFRGPPLGEACVPEPDAAPGAPCRSIVLYRKNLARAVKNRAELAEQIRVTLLHEIGHLRGEDDYELAARGLE